MKDSTRGPDGAWTPDPNDDSETGASFTTSRRGFLKGGAGFVAGAAAAPFLYEDAAAKGSDADETLDRLEKANGDSGRRILIKGGTIISMDPAVGNLAQGDILIEGKKITAIGPDLGPAAQDGKSVVIDAKDMIIIPGFCDPHIHSWQGQLPRIIPNQISAPPDPLHNYTAVMHQRFAPVYRPEDMYVGTLMTMLCAINGGITTVCDNSHNSRSSEHSDAAIEALFDSGVRGVHASGPPSFGTWDMQWPQDLYRMKEKYFSSDDQLVTMRAFPRAGYNPQDPAVLQARRDLDLWFTFDGGGGFPHVEFYANGIFDGRESFNHGTNFPLAGRQAIATNGGKVNVCPRIDSQFGYGGTGRGLPWIQEWLDVGLRPSMSNDDPATYAVDMFTEMHLYYAFQRGMAQNQRFMGNPTPPAAITVRDVLEAATIRGAEGCAVDHKVGTLTPGKEADIVMIDTNDVHLYPKHNAICTVVEGASVGNVDTVYIGGQLRKWKGKMKSKGYQLSTIRQMVDESRDYLFAAGNWPLPVIDFSD